MATRNYLPELTIEMKRLCRYLTKHRGIIDATLVVLLSPSDYTTVEAALNTLSAACSILEHLTGY